MGKTCIFGTCFLHFLEGYKDQTKAMVSYFYIWPYRPNQDLSNDILLISIEYHGLPPECVEITPQLKIDQLWRPKTPPKTRFSLKLQGVKKLDNKFNYNIL